MIFARSPQAKGRVERMGGTFQDRLVTELRLAGANSIMEANRVLEQFLPRFNQRFRVPPQHPEPAFRPLDPELCLAGPVLQAPQERGQGQHGEVPAAHPPVAARAGTPQLCRGGCGGPGRTGRPASVRHEGRILAAQEAPPSPVFLRDGHGRSAPVPVPPSGANGLGERWTAALEPLDSRAEEEKDQGAITDSAATVGKPKPASPRKPTFLQRERWKAIQKARRKGMSLERSSIHTWCQGPAETSSSDTMAT